MKNSFRPFLNGKGLSLLSISLFLFFFAASQGFRPPTADNLLSRGQAGHPLWQAIHTYVFRGEEASPGNKGRILASLTNKNETAAPAGKPNQPLTPSLTPASLTGVLAEPGGPILVVGAASNPFSKYATEILLAEGLNAYASSDISLVSASMLGNYDVVIVGDIPLTDAQVTLFSDWTNAGGTLIAFSPDPKLATLLGLTPAGGILENKYLLVNTASGPGKGIVNQTMQFQCAADLYTLNGATAVATIYAGPGNNTATAYPAVTMRTVGTLGGGSSSLYL